MIRPAKGRGKYARGDRQGGRRCRGAGAIRPISASEAALAPKMLAVARALGDHLARRC